MKTFCNCVSIKLKRNLTIIVDLKIRCLTNKSNNKTKNLCSASLSGNVGIQLS